MLLLTRSLIVSSKRLVAVVPELVLKCREEENRKLRT